MDFRFSAPLSHQNSGIGWSNIIYIPEEFHPTINKQTHLRVKVTYNNQVSSHVSLKQKDGGYYLVLNNAVRKELKLSDGDQVEVRVEEELSEYGMPMPEELALMLAEDDSGNIHFHKLTPGKQRSLIHLVSKVKNVDSRIRKALAIVEHLNEVNGILDFKGLNEKIKEVNQRSKYSL